MIYWHKYKQTKKGHAISLGVRWIQGITYHSVSLISASLCIETSFFQAGCQKRLETRPKAAMGCPPYLSSRKERKHFPTSSSEKKYTKKLCPGLDSLHEPMFVARGRVLWLDKFQSWGIKGNKAGEEECSDW